MAKASRASGHDPRPDRTSFRAPSHTVNAKPSRAPRPLHPGWTRTPPRGSLSPFQRALYLVLWERWGRRSMPCFESQQALARQVGVDVRTIRRAETSWRASGLVNRTSLPGRSRTLVFLVDPTPGTTAPRTDEAAGRTSAPPQGTAAPAPRTSEPADPGPARPTTPKEPHETPKRDLGERGRSAWEETIEELGLCGRGFERPCGEWAAYRREAKIKAWPKATWKKKLGEFSENPDQFSAAVSYSVGNGYQGLFSPRSLDQTSSRSSRIDSVLRQHAQMRGIL